jgi:hypothetical protein
MTLPPLPRSPVSILSAGWRVMADAESYARAYGAACAAAEREACAKVCEGLLSDTMIAHEEYIHGREMAATICAAAIRSRAAAKETTP